MKRMLLVALVCTLPGGAWGQAGSGGISGGGQRIDFVSTAGRSDRPFYEILQIDRFVRARTARQKGQPDNRVYNSTHKLATHSKKIYETSPLDDQDNLKVIIRQTHE